MEWNEMLQYFDKIIKDYNFHLIRENEEFLNKHPDRKEDFKLTTVVIDDEEHRRWLFYDGETKTTYMNHYGEVAYQIFDSLVKSVPDNPNHEKFMEKARKHKIPESVLNECVKWAALYRDKILQIVNEISKNDQKDTLHAFDIWRQNRHIMYTKIWGREENLYSSSMEDMLEFCYDWTQEKVEEAVASDHEEAEELNDDMERVFKKNLFIFHDTIVIPDEEYGYIWGKVYVARDYGDTFSFDLLRILQGRVEKKIHLCPRCSSLFYSNDSKKRYCPDCRQEKNKIRQEKRMENPARKIHKNIIDSLRNTYGGGTVLDEFITESNYYWECVQGKQVSPHPGYDDNIQTKEDYLKWLEDYQAKIRKRKKPDKG